MSAFITSLSSRGGVRKSRVMGAGEDEDEDGYEPGWVLVG